MQITHAPKIEGKWAGENWSNIDLHSAQEAGDGYAGSFEDAAGNRGAMKLEWSMLSGRFEGNWSVGPDRSGSIVLRRSELDSLRGAISLDPSSVPAKNETRLRDFHWKSAGTPSQEAHHEQLTLVAAPETGKIVRMLRNSVVPSVPTIHVFWFSRTMKYLGTVLLVTQPPRLHSLQKASVHTLLQLSTSSLDLMMEVTVASTSRSKPAAICWRRRFPSLRLRSFSQLKPWYCCAGGEPRAKRRMQQRRRSTKMSAVYGVDPASFSGRPFGAVA